MPDWTEFTENMTTQTRTHGPTHELTAIDSTPQEYDSKGNLTANANGQVYAWDFDNMLATAAVPSSPSEGIEGTHEYEYDALGRRVAKTVDDVGMMASTTAAYVQSGQIVLAEYAAGTAANNPLRKYVNASYVDEPVLLIDRTDAGATSAGTDELLYYHRNQQYSITALTNAGGSVVERYAYTAYGQPTILDASATTLRSASDFGNPYTYTARALDHETGMFYFRARMYHATSGRFIRRDPLGYHDGFSLVCAYFCPAGIDPFGTVRGTTTAFDPTFGVPITKSNEAHHWFMKYHSTPGKGQALVSAKCGGLINIDDYTTEYTWWEHRFIHGQHGGWDIIMHYDIIYEGTVSSSRDCCDLLIGVAAMMEAFDYLVNLAHRKGVILGPDGPPFDLINYHDTATPPNSNMRKFLEKIRCACGQQNQDDTNERISRERDKLFEQLKGLDGLDGMEDGPRRDPVFPFPVIPEGPVIPQPGRLPIPVRPAA